MSSCSIFFKSIVGSIFTLLILNQQVSAESQPLKRMAVFDLQTAKDVQALRALKRRQTVRRDALPEQVGVRVLIKPRGVRKLVLRINGERVRRLRGRRNIVKARRGLGLSSEWKTEEGTNTFTATSIYSEGGSRRKQRKVKKIEVIDTVDPTPTPTPEQPEDPQPTPQPTVEPTSTPQPTPQPTVEPTSTPQPTPQPTVEPTSTPQPTPQPTVEPTPTPTAQPVSGVCGAGVNKVLALPGSSVQFGAYCTISPVTSIHWEQTAGPQTVSFSSTQALAPVVSGFSTAGVYKFRVTIEHAEGSTIDTMQVGVSNSVSGYNFTAGITGPENVVRGFPLYLALELEKTAGSHDYVYAAVSGLPHGMKYAMAGWAESCCNNGDRGWEPNNTLLQLSVDSSVSPGTYPLTVQVSSGGVIRSIPYSITVLDIPETLTVTAVGSVPPIPRLSQWEHTMTHFGDMWCNADTISLWEGSVWYYDGMRVFYQIADYTGNSYWANTCVPIVRDVYRQYVLSSNGAVQGWRVFPHGLQMDFERKGAAESRNAALLMAQNSAYSNSGGAVSIDEMRETAYLINAYSIAEELGANEHHRLQRSVAFALGHLDQVAISKSDPKVKPFMIALTFEALIRYYEKTGDPRIPSVLKESAEFLWEESGAWDANSQSFRYINQNFVGEDAPEPAPDLNLLIAPLFAWLYHKTGESKFQQWGDAAFAGGITEDFDNDTFYEGGACLGCTGKIFSQNYRWSIDYVQWRQNPPQ